MGGLSQPEWSPCSAEGGFARRLEVRIREYTGSTCTVTPDCTPHDDYPLREMLPYSTFYSLIRYVLGGQFNLQLN